MERHEHTCVPGYFRCIIGTWRIMYGWLRLINKISLTSAILLTGLATIPQFSHEIQGKLGISAIVCESIALFCEEMYDYAGEAIKERKKLLAEVVKEEHENPETLQVNVLE